MVYLTTETPAPWSHTRNGMQTPEIKLNEVIIICNWRFTSIFNIMHLNSIFTPFEAANTCIELFLCCIIFSFTLLKFEAFVRMAALVRVMRFWFQSSIHTVNRSSIFITVTLLLRLDVYKPQEAAAVFPIPFISPDCFRIIQSQSHFTADSQSVCLGVESILWTFDQILLPF
jgi:hypothetical protein